jgi:hypothetical protein
MRIGPGRAAGAALIPVALLAAGCGTAGDRRDARAVTQRFIDAVHRRSGERACAQLDAAARQTLEQQAKAPCVRAVTTLQIAARRTAHAVVYLDDARVDLAGGRAGEAVFLGRTPAGWRISAAGCTPQGERPYDCDLEA